LVDGRSRLLVHLLLEVLLLMLLMLLHLGSRLHQFQDA
jgi:hypothetical protein